MNPESEVLFNRFTAKAKFRHMLILIRLIELGSMKRAADAIGVSQPAMSLMISELEKLLGVPLFLRHARGVEPTRIAQELVPVARRVIAALGDGAEILASLIQQGDGYVRVAATPAAVGGLLHPFLAGFARRFPRIHVDVNETTLANPLDLITDDACDILCSREPSVVPEGWTFHACRTDSLIVICGVDNPLAAQAQVTLADLGRQRWLLTRTGSVARRHFESLAREADWPPGLRGGVITHTPALTLELLNDGGYVTLIPHSVALPWIHAGRAKAVPSPASQRLPDLGFLRQATGGSRASAVFAEALSAGIAGAEGGPDQTTR
ncbi:MAG: LysR family transcriptional regulator [Burkholderiaceae bacterium]